eukprot:SAG11_NODE_16023_length_559_cov_0.715217_1_plen_111_part_10
MARGASTASREVRGAVAGSAPGAETDDLDPVRCGRGIVVRFVSTKQDAWRIAGRSITRLQMASAGSLVASQHHHGLATRRRHVEVASPLVGELLALCDLVYSHVRHSHQQ